MSVDPSFMFYQGGIYDGAGVSSRCTSGAINHVLLLVGYNQTDPASSYLTLKNSWGASWGEGGFARLVMVDRFVTPGTCGIYQVG